MMIAVLCLPVCVMAQTIDYNKIILPPTIKPTTFGEKLVQLAWSNHPSVKSTVENTEIARLDRTLSRWQWLDGITATGNLNEFTITGNTEQATLFPRYNFAVSVSLGQFVRVPTQTNIAKSRMLNAGHDVNEKKLEVREQVMAALEKLKESYLIINLRKKGKEDFRTMYVNAEKKFLSGDLDIEKYQSAIQFYYVRSEELVQATSTFNQEKLALESLVGINLEEIEGYAEYLRELDQLTLDE